MSVELDGFNPEDRRISATAAIAAGELLVAQGVEPSHAATTGAQGGEYAAGVIFATLRKMGHWPPENFDADQFERTAHSIVHVVE